MDTSQNAATDSNSSPRRQEDVQRNSSSVEEMDELQTRTRYAVGCVFFTYLILVMFIVYLITSKLEQSTRVENANVVNIETSSESSHQMINNRNEWIGKFSAEEMEGRMYNHAYVDERRIEHSTKMLQKGGKRTQIHWQNKSPFSIEYFYFPPTDVPPSKSRTFLEPYGSISTLADYRQKYVVNVVGGDVKAHDHSTSFSKGHTDEFVRIYYNDSHGIYLEIDAGNDKYARKRGDYHHKITAMREAKRAERTKEIELEQKQKELELKKLQTEEDQAEAQQCSNSPLIRDMRIPSHHHELTGWRSFWRLVWDWSILMQSCTIVGAITFVVCMYRMFKLMFAISYLDAAHFGDLRAIKGYIKGQRRESLVKPFNINAINQDQFTALHLAVRAGFLDIVELLCKSGADYTTILSKDKRTPLHSACSRIHLDVFNYLVSKMDIDVDAVDKQGISILHTSLNNLQACSIEKHEDAKRIFERLIKAGVDTTIHSTCIHPDSTVAAKPGSQIEYCRNFIRSCWHDSEVHEAVYNDDFGFFKDFDTPLNVDCKGRNDWTPLHVACLLNRVLIAKALVMVFKANIFAKTNKGETPLMIAAMKGNFELLRMILKAMKLAEVGISLPNE